MAKVTAVATVFPDTGLLRFLLSPKTHIMVPPPSPSPAVRPTGPKGKSHCKVAGVQKSRLPRNALGQPPITVGWSSVDHQLSAVGTDAAVETSC